MIRLFFLLLLLFSPVACERQENAGKQDGGSPEQTKQKVSPGPASGGETAAGPAGPMLRGEEKLPYPIDLQQGAKIYREVCATCHREGIAGAPEMGDKEAWQPRIAKGLPILVEHSIKGYQGNQGVMPPKGGAKSLSNEEVASAVVYMVRQIRETAR